MDKAIYSTEQVALSRLLRETREQIGLRQVDVAERLGVPQSFVSKYEIGERRLDLLELRQVALALGVPLSKIVAQLEQQLASESATYTERAALRSTEPAGPPPDDTGPAADKPS
ncbi:helix-turn-helix domain-containing protein [uncultured Jatrophihabitans sp.]|uniref:helix-turn-helix domain-containing protein n=1 Tax=uncultured Jatrophihabitans sp. TaxID=1610747 RepID=UPI0035CB649A